MRLIAKYPLFNVTLLMLSLIFSMPSYAEVHLDQAVVADTVVIFEVWIAVCVALVLLMQAGFLLLEGGMVRSKNAINVMLKNFTDIGLGTMGFWILGYGLMFGVNSTGWIGLSNFMPVDADGPTSLSILYQMMFAATAATIVSGAVAERFSFLPYVFAALVITSFIYPVFGSWVWGGSGDERGWLAAIGFHDAAGSTVVHSIGAWCALGAILILGPRSGRFSRKGEVHEISGHNLPFVALGGFVLWFGWFGFNGGAAAGDFSNLGQILLNTHLGAVGGIVGVIVCLTAMRKGFHMTTIVNGALGGLVSITAACDVIAPQYAALSGVVGGMVVVFTSNLLNNFKIDDVVGAIPVHGFCGAWGTLVVGLFYQGDMFNLERIIAQLVGVVAALVWGLGISYVLFWVVNKVSPIRVSTRMEQRGLDISEHKEIGYSDFMTTHVKADH